MSWRNNRPRAANQSAWVTAIWVSIGLLLLLGKFGLLRSIPLEYHGQLQTVLFVALIIVLWNVAVSVARALFNIAQAVPNIVGRTSLQTASDTLMIVGAGTACYAVLSLVVPYGAILPSAALVVLAVFGLMSCVAGWRLR
jgi:hypothetical protein